ncbi:MAG: NlpC/P60 family protein [Desulfuromonadales bacterium]
MKNCARLPVLLLIALLMGGCSPVFSSRTFSASPPQAPPTDPIGALIASAPPDSGQTTSLAKMGYSTQVGAFANIDNAVRLERRLDALGIDAYYFRHPSGLYKVRFGNHETYRAARAEAERLQAEGLIGRFFIVNPQDYSAARIQSTGKGDLRADLVRTAREFLGVPYRWGGTDREDGFDCSGLTMVCYRLNGLNLPRVSRSQFRKGQPVTKGNLKPGDLVFFATHGGRRVSHVGIYIGQGKFIHAPRTGKTVRVARLSNPYFERTFVGARRYF